MLWFRIKGFFQKEMAQILRDPVMLRLLFVIPVIQITLVGFALSTESKNIKLAIYGSPKDSVLREIRDRAVASGRFVIAQNVAGDPFEAIRSDQAEVAISTETEPLTKRQKNETAKLQVLIESLNAPRAIAINNYVNAILQEVSQETFRHTAPITIAPRILYNPELKTSYFLIPGLMGTMVCIITVLLTSMGFTREKEIGTMETIMSTPIGKGEIIIGKAIPFFFMGLFNILSVCMVAILVFNMPFRGQFLSFLIIAITFIFCTLGIGISISTFCKTQQQAMMGSFLFIFPTLLLSGLMFPIENMPSWMIILTDINPLTHFNYVVRNIVLKGGEFYFVLKHGLIIFGLGVAAFSFAYHNFKMTLN